MFFGGGGGFPFGGFGGGEQEEEQQEQTLWDILEVKEDATPQQLDEAYKKLSQQHKDDTDKMEELKQAYEILKDPKKRELYKKQAEQQAALMKMMFGGGAPGGKSSSKPKVKPKRIAVDVTLENIYKGELVQVDVKRYRICQACHGTGGEDVKSCEECKGQGVTVKLVQVAPMAYAQMQEHCAACKGQGEMIDEDKKCKTCKGEKILQKQIKVPVAVQKGTPNGEKIVVANQGDEFVTRDQQQPDTEAGDLHMIVQVKEHDVFTVEKSNLKMKKKITLVEALTGYSFSLTHLDSKSYRVQTTPGEVLADKSKRVLVGLGLPKYNKQGEYGDLIIQFEIEMPTSINAKDYEALAQILPGSLDPRPKDHKYELLEDFDPADLNTNEEGGHAAEDEEQMEGEGVRCATH